MRALFLFKSQEDAGVKTRQRRWSPAVALISESFSLRFNKRPGDRFLVFTVANGTREFRVAAVYYDYASNQGTV